MTTAHTFRANKQHSDFEWIIPKWYAEHGAPGMTCRVVDEVVYSQLDGGTREGTLELVWREPGVLNPPVEKASVRFYRVDTPHSALCNAYPDPEKRAAVARGQDRSWHCTVRQDDWRAA